MDAESGWKSLLGMLEDMGSVVVCYSSGVDSSLLLHAAMTALPNACHVFMADIPFLSGRQRLMAGDTLERLYVDAEVMELTMDDMGEACLNDDLRCYHCKDAIFRKAIDFAGSLGVRHVIDGENADDDESERPGRRAAREHGVRSPLRDVGLTRDEIESLVVKFDLPIILEKETCLATRLMTGVIDEGRLRLVEEGERVIRSLCDLKELRLRCHDDSFTIEVRDDDIPSILRMRRLLVDGLRPLGIRELRLRPYGSHGGAGEVHTLAEDMRA